MNKTYTMLWLLVATASLSLSSCTEGFEDESNFDSGVHHKLLESPTTAEAKMQTASDGSDCYEVTWPVVFGAGGYQINVDIYDDPTAPVSVADTIIDRTSFTFKILEDTKYLVQIRSLANTYYKKTDNKDATSASPFIFNTAIPAQTIPEGSDIAQFINDFFAKNDSLSQPDREVAFELETGKTYTLDTLVNTTLANVTLRGDKINRSLITVGEKGGFSIYGGLKLKFLDFDCTNATHETGILSMGKEQIESLYYAYSEGAQTYYHDVNTILVQECVFKSLPKAFFTDGKVAWCVKDFRIKDSYIEMNNNTNPFIDFDNGGCSIKDLSFSNSTFTNLQSSSAYFIRFSNGSNSSIHKSYGPAYKGRFTMDHCTLIRCTTNGQFGNNCWTTGTYTTIDWKNCIFYDTNLLQKLVRNLPCDFNNGNNTIWQVSATVDNTDLTKFATEEDPQFAGGNPSGDVIEGYDLTKVNGGLNYKPTNGLAASSKFGDPRWFE